VIVAPGVKPDPVTVTGVPVTPEVGVRVIDARVVLGTTVKVWNAAKSPPASLTTTRPVCPVGERLAEAGTEPDELAMNWRAAEQGTAFEITPIPDSKQ